MEDERRPRTVPEYEEKFRNQKIMPLEDVDMFSEDDMHGDYVRFFAVRYPDPKNRRKKRWAIEALFYLNESPKRKTVESRSDGASAVGENLPKPRSKWDIKEKTIDHFLIPRERMVDRCTFEETRVNGQRRLVCCRGESVPLALQEFIYLGVNVLGPKDLLHIARQFQASGKMHEQEWHRAFLNFVNEDLDDFSPDKEFYKPITRESWRMECARRRKEEHVKRLIPKVFICSVSFAAVTYTILDILYKYVNR
jgi:hypothetical protein